MKEFWNHLNKPALGWIVFSIFWGIGCSIVDNTKLYHPWWACTIGFLFGGTIVTSLACFAWYLIFGIIFPNKPSHKLEEEDNDYLIFFTFIFTILTFIGLNIWWFIQISK